MLRHVTFAAIRDAALLAGGMALLGYETLVSTEPRVVLLTIAAVMMGLPATFAADRWFVPRAPQPPSVTPAPPSDQEPTA